MYSIPRWIVLLSTPMPAGSGALAGAELNRSARRSSSSTAVQVSGMGCPRSPLLGPHRDSRTRQGGLPARRSRAAHLAEAAEIHSESASVQREGRLSHRLARPD